MKNKIKKLKNGDFKVKYEKPSTSYNIPIKFIFVGMLLTSCNGWSIMGYALDESQEDKVDSTEINE